MVNGALLCGRNEFPIRTKRGIDSGIPGDDESINAELGE